MRFIIPLFRIIVSLLFIFSGLIKANDPLGFSYKLDEYFEVFGTEWMKPLSLSLSIFMCALEVLLGFMLLIGARKKITLWLLLLLILFFASLNFYSGYYDKVRECGCFGDAIKMTPWQEFGNNMAMMVMTIIMLAKNSYIRPLFGKLGENILVVLAIIAAIVFPLYTYNFLPIKDFRPYAIGKNIQEGMNLPPNAKRDSVQMVFIYERNGKQLELTPDQIKQIDSTFKFVDRKDKVIREGDKAPIYDFSIISLDGVDHTEEILNHTGYYFFLVCYDLNNTNKEAFVKINEFVKQSKAHNIPFIGLTSSSGLVEGLKKTTGADFNFYLTDATQLKTMIRSNPGLMLLKQGTVIAMWHYHSIPNYNEVKEKYFKK